MFKSYLSDLQKGQFFTFLNGKILYQCVNVVYYSDENMKVDYVIYKTNKLFTWYSRDSSDRKINLNPY